MLHERAPWLYRAIAPFAWRAKRAHQLALDVRDARDALTSIRSAATAGSAPHIVIDGVVFQSALEGIARVWSHLLDEWEGTDFAEHLTVLDRGGTAPRHAGIRYVTLPPARARDSFVQRRLLEEVCGSLSADLFISTLYTRPSTTPTLLFVHDLTPEILGWDTTLPEWAEIRHAIDHASAYVTISENTAHDLRRLHPTAQGKPLTVALLAADRTFEPQPAADVSSFRARYELPEHYFLFVGHRDNHKNGRLVFEALSKIPRDTDIGLMAVGGSPVLERDYAGLSDGLPVSVARLTDDELRVAYAGAAALLYPSRYEGFGLPILEAMSSGCPVITAPTSSIPEVAGDAALYVDVDDAESLVRAMQDVLVPATRDDLVAKGLRQAARFSWAQTARAARVAIEAAANHA